LPLRIMEQAGQHVLAQCLPAFLKGFFSTLPVNGTENAALAAFEVVRNGQCLGGAEKEAGRIGHPALPLGHVAALTARLGGLLEGLGAFRKRARHDSDADKNTLRRAHELAEDRWAIEAQHGPGTLRERLTELILPRRIAGEHLSRFGVDPLAERVDHRVLRANIKTKAHPGITGTEADALHDARRDTCQPGCNVLDAGTQRRQCRALLAPFLNGSDALLTAGDLSARLAVNVLTGRHARQSKDRRSCQRFCGFRTDDAAPERLATLRDLLVSVLLLAAGLDILSELIEPRLTRILFENAERIAQQAAMLARIGDRLGFCRRAIKSMLEAKASDGRLDLARGLAHTDLRL